MYVHNIYIYIYIYTEYTEQVNVVLYYEKYAVHNNTIKEYLKITVI